MTDVSLNHSEKSTIKLRKRRKRIILDSSVSEVFIDESFSKVSVVDVKTPKGRVLKRTPGPGLQLT